MKKYIIIVSLIVTASSALGQLLFSQSIPQWANVILLLLIFLLSILVLVMQNPIQQLLKLSSITNNIPKNTTRITSVEEFLKSSKEESLISGDSIKILTNNLCSYDLLDANIDVLADNLSEGVRYEYYLPLDADAELKENLKEFIRKISSKTSINSFFNLKVFRTNHPLLFSYAVVKNKISNKPNINGYWYIATSSVDSNLTIVSIEGDSKNELLNVFDTLTGKEIDVIEMAKNIDD